MYTNVCLSVIKINTYKCYNSGDNSSFLTNGQSSTTNSNYQNFFKVDTEGIMFTYV
jgi:hypothetical protein